ncbi:MAG: leucine-rich repeat domain-containing protein [Alphaproteobacteria bacterium]|nr:leucine-rich repeat domain-containing protein [Alphaproteobacteria bacterium]
MKKLILILMVMFGFKVYAANTCGDDLNVSCWDCGKTETDLCTAKKEGTKLIITGTGDMKDYYRKNHFPDAPQKPWGTNITELYIEGITSIGGFAFNKTKITEVTIPASVRRIELGAFQDSALEKVTFAENSNLESLGGAVFNTIPTLTNIELPQSLKRLENNSIFNKSGIDKIVLPDSLFAEDSEGVLSRALNGVRNVYCSDAVRDKCEAYFNQAEFNENDIWYPMKEKATLYISNSDGSVDMYQYAPDGSVAIYRDGQLKAYKGKRIYTIDEANAVTKPTGNTVRIKYR